ncbi:replication protein RepA, partial [Thalassospira sp. CH_XMU1420-2]|uniref:replication protein RepA n=1 Tax=Thalassospira sp. CH_XMU1420-2 TaxID=3107769 RepID=UPI003008DB48
MSGPNDEVTIHEQIELFGLKNYVSMHPEREKDALIAHGAVQDEGKDITFLHRGFCSVGLPLRNPIKNTNAGSKSPIWSKSDGDFTLSITGSDFHMDENQQEFRSGIPYGPKARLIAMYIADQIHDPRRSLDDRSVEFGGITQWLTNAGVGVTGGKRGSITATKEELVRFLCARCTMRMRAKRGSLFGDDDEETI